jgi:hypothetical protein
MESEDLFASLEKHLKDIDEIEIILLKGHLILEQILNEMLMIYIQDESDLDKLNLSFSRKLDLLSALMNGQKVSIFEFQQLREINRIRNRLAHVLDFSRNHSDLKAWACKILGYTPVTIDRKRTYKNTLLKAFYFLTAFLLGATKEIKANSHVEHAK